VLAQVLVAKYCDHLPLYRQAQIFARNGIDLDRLTLASWVGRACWWLRPPAELLLGTILSSPKIFADDTPVPVLDPGRGRTKTGRPWAYARDDRPWRGPMPPAVAYVYSENRQGVHPRSHLPRGPGAGRVHSDRFSQCPVDRALALLSQVRTGLAGERTGFEPSVPRKRDIDFRASRST
jgi:transposase